MNIVKVPKAEAKAHFAAHRYSKGVGNAAMCWGLPDCRGGYYAVAAYAVPCSNVARGVIFGAEHMHRVYDLQRLARRDDCPIQMSQFMKLTEAALLAYRPDTRAITAFSDASAGHDGALYRICGWTERPPQRQRSKFYLDGDGRLRHPRQRGVNITDAMAAERGWTPVMRDPKSRFYKIIGPDRRERRKWAAIAEERLS